MTAVALVLGIVALVALWLADGWMRAKHAQDSAIKQRELELREREIAVAERVERVEVPAVSQFPSEALSFVSDESEEWAREAAVLLVGEAYVDAGGDWKRAGSLLSHRYAMQPESRLPKHLLG